MRRIPAFVLAALVLAPTVVGAADVPVTYTVDTTALKLAISGTNLTFQLYTDPACTSLAHTQVLTIDATNMQSVLKRSKPKNGVKPPKTTDIRATLTGVAPAAPLYAKITGIGITPVGGPCQVQASTAAGAASGALVLKDSNGLLIGQLDLNGTFAMSDGGTLLQAYASPGGFFQGAGFQYTSTDCSGPKLSNANFGIGGFGAVIDGVEGTTLYYGPTSAPLVTIGSFDYRPQLAASCTGTGQVFTLPDICCCQSPACTSAFSANAGPPSSMDISVFVPPFIASLQ